MSSIDTQVRGLEALLAARETWRAARADFIAAFNAAREAGVSDTALSDALIHDSVVHGELDPLLSLARDLGLAA